MKKNLLFSTILLSMALGGLVSCNSTHTTSNEPSTPSSEQQEIALGSSVLGNWVYRNDNGGDRTSDNEEIEVYVDSETKFHFTVTKYYENFAPSIFTYEGQITGVSKGVAACIPVFMGSYLSHGSYNEETKTAANTQFKDYKANTIPNIYEGEGHFEITFHRLANDVYNNGYFTVDKADMDLTFGVFDVVDNATSQSLYKAKEITLGSSVLGNWVSENMNDKKQINKVYVDSETKFHFTIMQYYENFAPSIFTYEGQITGVSKGVAACIPVFMGAYLSHGSYNEETKTTVNTQFKDYKENTIPNIYEGEGHFEITFHRLANDVYSNGYFTVDKADMDLTFGSFSTIDK